MAKKKRKCIDPNRGCYIRAGTFDIITIENLIKKQNLDSLAGEKVKDGIVRINGHKVHAVSDRYKNVFVHGYICKHCGLTASFFALERDNCEGSRTYHLNIYGRNQYGHEVMMTKDHIIPRSKGGLNHISNYQPLCIKCNRKKGAISEEEIQCQIVNERAMPFAQLVLTAQ